MKRRRHESRFSLFAFQDIITSVTGIMILVTLVLAVELIERTESSPREATNQSLEQLLSQITENENEIRSLEARQKRSQESSSQLAALDATTLRRRIAERREQNAILARQIAKAQRERIAAVRRKDDAESRNQNRLATEERRQNNLKRQINETIERIEKLVSGKRVVFNPAKGVSKNAWVAQISARTILVAPMGRASKPTTFKSAAAFRTWSGSRDASADYILLVVKPDGIAPFKAVKEHLRSRGFSIGYDLIGADQTAVDPKSGAASP